VAKGDEEEKKGKKCSRLRNCKNFIIAKLVGSESPLIAGYFIDFGVEYQRGKRRGIEEYILIGIHGKWFKFKVWQ
jgi:hypothetical protein